MAHTKGPWLFGPFAGSTDQFCIGLSRDKHGHVSGASDHAYMLLSGICKEDDARLIAAAPDMLEALRALDQFWLADWEPPHPDKTQQEPRILTAECLDVWRNVRKAIASATKEA